MLIKIVKTNLMREDDRGNIYDFSIPNRKYVLAMFRKKGTVSGKHVHTASIKSKNPEIFYVVSGKAKFVVRNLQTKEEEIHEVVEGNLIEIPANVYHEVHAITDIYFLEFNYSKEDFEKQETTKY